MPDKIISRVRGSAILVAESPGQGLVQQVVRGEFRGIAFREGVFVLGEGVFGLGKVCLFRGSFWFRGEGRDRKASESKRGVPTRSKLLRLIVNLF